MKKLTALAFGIAVAVSLTGCGSLTGGKRIIRVSHAQSETHPEHLGLLAFMWKRSWETNMRCRYFQMNF